MYPNQSPLFTSPLVVGSKDRTHFRQAAARTARALVGSGESVQNQSSWNFPIFSAGFVLMIVKSSWQILSNHSGKYCEILWSNVKLGIWPNVINVGEIWRYPGKSDSRPHGSSSHHLQICWPNVWLQPPSRPLPEASHWGLHIRQPWPFMMHRGRQKALQSAWRLFFSATRYPCFSIDVLENMVGRWQLLEFKASNNLFRPVVQ